MSILVSDRRSLFLFHKEHQTLTAVICITSTLLIYACKYNVQAEQQLSIHRQNVMQVLATSVGISKGQEFVWLSKAMSVCPQPVYDDLRPLFERTLQCSNIANFPAMGKGKLKSRLVKGLKGSYWTSIQKVAIARLLLSSDNAALFSHLGSCKQVRAYRLHPSLSRALLYSTCSFIKGHHMQYLKKCLLLSSCECLHKVPTDSR
jgi:hypothetical protein